MMYMSRGSEIGNYAPVEKICDLATLAISKPFAYTFRVMVLICSSSSQSCIRSSSSRLLWKEGDVAHDFGTLHDGSRGIMDYGVAVRFFAVALASFMLP